MIRIIRFVLLMVVPRFLKYAEVCSLCLPDGKRSFYPVGAKELG